MQQPSFLSHAPSRCALIGVLVLVLVTLASGQETEFLAPRADRSEVVIKLNTGEWLRGRVESLNYGRLHFNSAKLDRVNLDWTDIHYFRSSETYEYHFRDDSKVRALGTIDRQYVTLRLDDGSTQRLDRSELVAMYPGNDGFRNARWFGRVSGSYDVASGNSDEESIDFAAEVTRRSGSLEAQFEARTSFSESESEEVRKKHSLRIQANYDLNLKYYAVLMRSEVAYDKFQNVDLRLRGSLGGGINLVRDTDVNWRLEAGPAYESTKFRDVAVGEDRDEQSIGIFLATHLSWRVNKDVDFYFDAESFVSTENSDDATHTLKTTLSFDVAADVDLDFSVILERNENPERGGDGVLPERDDVRFLIGFCWDF